MRDGGSSHAWDLKGPWYSAGVISVIGVDRSIFVFTGNLQCSKSYASTYRKPAMTDDKGFTKHLSGLCEQEQPDPADAVKEKPASTCQVSKMSREG